MGGLVDAMRVCGVLWGVLVWGLEGAIGRLQGAVGVTGDAKGC